MRCSPSLKSEASVEPAGGVARAGDASLAEQWVVLTEAEGARSQPQLQRPALLLSLKGTSSPPHPPVKKKNKKTAQSLNLDSQTRASKAHLAVTASELSLLRGFSGRGVCRAVALRLITGQKNAIDLHDFSHNLQECSSPLPPHQAFFLPSLDSHP